MLFCLSVCDRTKRVILDQDWYGEVLAVIEGRDWQEARQEADTHPALNGFTYRAGWGWECRVEAQNTNRSQECRGPLGKRVS